MDQTEEESTKSLPPPPERPLDSDCCGQGCVPCILDIYQDELTLWKAECDRIRRGESSTAPLLEVSSLKPDTYSKYPIESISNETADILRVRCSLMADQPLGLTMGQHVIVRCRKLDGSAVTRQYTPVSPLDAKGYFEFLIKVYPCGIMSQLVKDWTIGHSIEVRGPHGALEYRRNKFRRVLMLCAGTGVAPMCQVCDTVLADPEEETVLRLVYATPSYPQLMAKTEIDEWARYWNFSLLFVLSQEPESPSYKYKYGDTILRQRLTKDLVKTELGEAINNTLVLVCGTRSFDSDVLDWLSQIGVPKENTHKF